MMALCTIYYLNNGECNQKSEAVNRRGTDIIMAKKKKEKKRKTMRYKTLHRKLKIGQRELH